MSLLGLPKLKVVVLCGSSLFVEKMAVCAWLIERNEGAITLRRHLSLAGRYADGIPDHLAGHEGVEAKMDQLHLRKIDLADEVFVVNVDDYIGESTQKEIAYARKHGKALRWYTHDPVGEKTKEMFIIADYKSNKRLDEAMLRWQEQESIKEEKARERRECWQFPGR